MAGADFVRAASCLAVFGLHVRYYFAPTILPADGLIGSLLAAGHNGVPALFTLSGFLLAMPYWRAAAEGSCPQPFAGFMARRMARVMPGFYCCILLLTAMLGVNAVGGFVMIATHLTFTNTLFPQTFFFPSDNACWSIAVEMQCYLLFAIFFLPCFRGRAWWRSLAAVILGILILGRFSWLDTWLPMPGPLFCMRYFLVGVLAAATMPLLKKQPGEARPGWNLFDAASLVLMVAIVDTQALHRFVPEGMANPLSRGNWPSFPLMVGGLILSLCHGRLGTLLEPRPVRLTATLSYGIYLWQGPVLALSYNIIWGPSAGHRVTNALELLLFAGTALGLTYVVAALSYFLVEKPVLEWQNGKRADARVRS